MTKSDKKKILKNIVWPNDFSPIVTDESAYVIIGGSFPLIKGFVISSSGVKNKFYLHSFVQPLYVFFDTYKLTYGERVKDNDGVLWNKNDLNYDALNSAIQYEYERYIANFNDVGDYFNWLKDWVDDDSNSTEYFDLIYTCLALDKINEARSQLNKLIHILEKTNGSWVEDDLKLSKNMLKGIQSGHADKILLEMESSTEKMKKLFMV
jgi:hypothetical protein